MIKPFNFGNFRKRISFILSSAALLASVVVFCLVGYDFGFPISQSTQENLRYYYDALLIFLWVVTTIRFIVNGTLGKSSTHMTIKAVGYGIFTLIALTGISLSYGFIQIDSFVSLATSDFVVVVMILAVSFAEISAAITSVLSAHANPALILTGSFALIIVIGSLLLQLPNCTTTDVSYIDTLFISTSAVCVTGLTPINISTSFTTSGLVVLLLLIQFGGLGIMTITSFFGLFFAGGSSLSNQVMIKELLSGDSLNGLLRMIFKIIAVTVCVEAAGAVAIYSFIAGNTGIENPVFFSVFHSISAFCNAGFSTLSGNLYDPVIRNIGGVMWILSFLIIFGGIGFPIFANFLSVIWFHIKNFVRLIFKKRIVHSPRLWNLNSYIVIRITAILLVVSWATFLIFEWNNSLAEYDFWNKLAQGFMCAVTPRTAGFNGVDLSQMMPASILLTIVLMWIGGAPQSTAGGVKVTTIYLAMKNILSSNSLGQGIEVRRRKIPNYSVRRAFSVITLSITIISVAVIAMSIFDPNVELSRLIFEAVSAIGTVGLTLGLTPELTTYSKIVLIILMFIGRIGAITLFALFVRSTIHKAYSFPEENILIN